jgi:hypothetical protein
LIIIRRWRRAPRVENGLVSLLSVSPLVSLPLPYRSTGPSQKRSLPDDENDSDAMKPPRQRVAIVGSGMAGLVAGYLLANDKEGRFDVEVLEMVRVLIFLFNDTFCFSFDEC